MVFIHQGTLFGVRFDADRLEIQGTPTPLFEDIASNAISGLGQFDFAVSPAGPGTLVYLPGKGLSQGWPILWLDRSGATQVLRATPGTYSHPRISPDGRRLAFVAGTKGNDVFVYDWRRDAMTRLTFDGRATMPVWSPDGSHLAFQSTSNGFSISWVRADGGGEAVKLLENEHNLYPSSFSPDGRRLAYHIQYSEPRDDLWTVPLDISDADHPKPGKPELFLHEPFDNQFPMFSPDGHWIAYRSFETGRWEIYVRPFPGPGGKWQISTNGGSRALWSKHGRELFYRERWGFGIVDYAVHGDSFSIGKPRLWSNRILRPGEMNIDIDPDGKRCVGFPPQEETSTETGSLHVTFLLNVFDELRRKVPSRSK